MARSSDSSLLMSVLKDKTFQAREIRRVIILATVYLLITTVMLGIFYHLMLGQLVSGAAPLFFVSEDMQRFNEMVPALGSVLGKWILVMLAVNVVVTSVVSIYITRKLGHPILAIKRALRDIGNGDLDVRLRESDDREFSDISIALNEAMQTIRMHIVAAKQEVAALHKLQEQPAANDDEFKELVENCSAALEFFSASEARNETKTEASH